MYSFYIKFIFISLSSLPIRVSKTLDSFTAQKKNLSYSRIVYERILQTLQLLHIHLNTY